MHEVAVVFYACSAAVAGTGRGGSYYRRLVSVYDSNLGFLGIDAATGTGGGRHGIRDSAGSL